MSSSLKKQQAVDNISKIKDQLEEIEDVSRSESNVHRNGEGRKNEIQNDDTSKDSMLLNAKNGSKHDAKSSSITNAQNDGTAFNDSSVKGDETFKDRVSESIDVDATEDIKKLNELLQKLGAGERKGLLEALTNSTDVMSTNLLSTKLSAQVAERNIQIEAAIAKSNNEAILSSLERSIPNQFYNIVKDVELTIKLMEKYPIVDQPPRFFKLESIFSSIWNFQDYYVSCDNIKNLEISKTILESQNLFKNGTLSVNVVFTTNEYLSILNDPTKLDSEVLFTNVAFVGSNRSLESDFRILTSKIKTFLDVALNYRFIVRMGRLEYIDAIYDININATVRQAFGNSRVLARTRPHISFALLYNRWRRFQDVVTEVLYTDVLSDRPKFGRARNPEIFNGIKFCEYYFDSIDQFSAELAYINIDYLRNNHLLENEYVNMLLCNSTEGALFNQIDRRDEQLIYIPGINRNGWMKVGALVMLDDALKTKIYNLVNTILESRNIFTYRALDAITSAIGDDVSADLVKKFGTYIFTMKSYMRVDWINNAIALELLSGFFTPVISIESLGIRDVNSFLKIAVLLINFNLWPKTFFRAAWNFSEILYNFYKGHFPTLTAEFVSRYGWVVNTTNARPNGTGMEKVNGYVITLQQYLSGHYPTVFTNVPFADKFDIFRLWQFIEPNVENYHLDRKERVGYPYHRDDYMAFTYLRYSREFSEMSFDLTMRFDGILAFVRKMFDLYNRRINKIPNRDVQLFVNLFSLLSQCATETAVLSYFTLGVVPLDLMQSFAYMYDDFYPQTPWRSYNRFAVVSINNNVIASPIERFSGVRVIDSIAYDTFVFNLEGIVKRPLKLGTTSTSLISPLNPGVNPMFGEELTNFSLTLYHTTVRITEALYLMRAVLDDDVPVLDEVRQYFANHQFLNNSNFSTFIKLIERASSIDLNKYFNVVRNSVEFSRERRYIDPRLCYVNLLGYVIDEQNAYTSEDLWQCLPHYLNVLQLAERMVFSETSPIYKKFIGLVLGLYSNEIIPYNAVHELPELNNNYVFGRTFRRENYTRAVGELNAGTYAITLTYIYYVGDVEMVVREPTTEIITPHTLSVDYLSDLTEEYLKFIMPLVDRGLLFIKINRQKVIYTIEYLDKHRDVFFDVNIWQDVYNVKNEGVYSMVLFDNTNVLLTNFRQTIIPRTKTYLLPLQRGIHDASQVARHIQGDDGNEEGRVHEEFLTIDIDNWGAGGDDQVSGRYAVRMPSNNELKINSDIVNLDNVIPTLSDLVITDYPSYERNALGVRL